MKKIMLAAAVLATGVAVADIPSMNVVGYNTFKTSANMMDITGVGFIRPGGGDIDLQDITVDKGFRKSGGDWIKFYNPLTRTYMFAFYWDELYENVEDEDPIPNKEGWGDFEQTIIRGFKIAAGRGLWVQSKNAAGLTVSGEIAGKDDGEIATLANTMDIVCNPYPCDIDLQDLKVGEGFRKTGGDWIKIYDKEKRAYTFALYWDELYEKVEDEDPIEGVEGWGDFGQTIMRGVTIKASQGVWVQTKNKASLIFPSPL